MQSYVKICELHVDTEEMQPLLFHANGTQRNVTLSASSVHANSDVTGVSIHTAQYGEWPNLFYTAANDAYQWFQVQPATRRSMLTRSSCGRMRTSATSAYIVTLKILGQNSIIELEPNCTFVGFLCTTGCHKPS